MNEVRHGRQGTGIRENVEARLFRSFVTDFLINSKDDEQHGKRTSHRSRGSSPG